MEWVQVSLGGGRKKERENCWRRRTHRVGCSTQPSRLDPVLHLADSGLLNPE